MVKRVFLIIALFSLACLSLRGGHAPLDTEDRLFDVEAQLNTLKNDLEVTKKKAGQERANLFNPSISVIVDTIGQVGFGMKDHHDAHGHDHDHDHHHDHDHGHHHSHADFHDGVFLREVEFELAAEIDPIAKGLLALSVGQSSYKDYHFHVEEAYAKFIPWWVQIKAGRFKTAMGRMNRIHMHNIPQITYPLALRTFLGEEGFASQGLSFSRSFAFNQTSALSLVGEAVIGSRVPMQEEGAEKMPSAIAHAWLHQELAPSHFLDFGLSSLFGRQGEENSGLFWLSGLDLHYSYLPTGYGQDPIFLFGLESFLANQTRKNIWAPGGFSWAQMRLICSSFLGLRYDLAPKLDDLKGFQHALGAYLGYYHTEFLRFRVGYEHVMPSLSSFEGDHRLLFSMNFVLGSHPVEPYFANR